MYCGDCGGETRVERGYRICDACRSRERLPGAPRKRKPKPVLERAPLEYTGGGVRGACFEHGNAFPCEFCGED